MLSSIRSSLLRPPLRRPTSVAFLSTTPEPPVPAPVGKNSDPLADVIAEVDDSAPLPQSTKMWRIFRHGDVLRPIDLSRERCRNTYKNTRPSNHFPAAAEARYNDIFRQLNLDPVDFTLNPYVLSQYVSEMGKIYGRNITGLTAHSQRRLSKAIRRARMIGIIPQLSRPTNPWMTKSKRRIQ